MFFLVLQKLKSFLRLKNILPEDSFTEMLHMTYGIHANRKSSLSFE